MEVSATKSSAMQTTQKPIQAQMTRQQEQVQTRAREAAPKPPEQSKPTPWSTPRVKRPGDWST